MERRSGPALARVGEGAGEPQCRRRERARRHLGLCLREGGVLTRSKYCLLFTALLGAACALFASGAAAQNWVTLLKNTPAESFDDEDLRLFLDTARKVLD